MSLILKALEKAKSMAGARTPAAPPAALASFGFGRPTRSRRLRKLILFYIVPAIVLAAILLFTLNFWNNRLRTPAPVVQNDPPPEVEHDGAVLDEPDAPPLSVPQIEPTEPSVPAPPLPEEPEESLAPPEPQLTPLQQAVQLPQPVRSSTPQEPPRTESTRVEGPPTAPPFAASPAPAVAEPQVGITRDPFELALFYQQSGDYRRAFEQYERILQDDPLNAAVYNNIGLLHQATSNNLEAIRAFRNAILANPTYDKAYNNLGNALMREGRDAEAEFELQRALEINPQSADALTNLAVLARKSGRVEQAKFQYIKALAISPDHPEANYNLAVIYDEQGELGRALEHYRRFLRSGAGAYPDLARDVERKIEELSARTQFFQ